LGTQINSLRSEVAAIRKQGTTGGQLTCFSDLLGGVCSFEDVLAWVVANMGGKDSQEPREVLEEVSWRSEAIEERIRGHIYDAFVSQGLDRAAELAREMLGASVKFLKMLSEYLSSVYRSLTKTSGFSEEDAWSLATQVVRGMFIHLSSARSNVRGVSPKSSPVRNTAVILHALLKTHEAMAEFMRHEIKNHPVVASEYVKFLATHTPVGQMRELTAKVQSLEIMVRGAQGEARKANKGNKGVEGEGGAKK
jgi:hypothetical protein